MSAWLPVAWLPCCRNVTPQPSLPRSGQELAGSDQREAQKQGPGVAGSCHEVALDVELGRTG